MTPLNKPVRRRSDMALVKDRGTLRPLVVTFYPSGVLGLRPAGTRTEEFITLQACYETAIKQRVAKIQREKRLAKKAKKATA